MNQDLLDELLTLAQRDTETRTRLLSEGKLYGDYSAEMQDVHRENAKRLAEITAAHDWPGISLAGLAPFREDLEKHREEVKSEGGRPPKDFIAYKQKAQDWAASIGWV